MAFVIAQFLGVCSSVKRAKSVRISSPFLTRSQAHRRGSPMPMLSYVHQLFSAEPCQAYLHTLRWNDRPLHCPRCQSPNIRPWGTYHYRPGLHRYWGKGGRRTCNDLTHTLLAQTKRSLAHWLLATFLLCLSCSSRRMARELGGICRKCRFWGEFLKFAGREINSLWHRKSLQFEICDRSAAGACPG
jgi:transposase-like protein